MKYKFTKVLHFEDFRELMETLAEKSSNFNPIERILKEHPYIFEDRL